MNAHNVESHACHLLRASIFRNTAYSLHRSESLSPMALTCTWGATERYKGAQYDRDIDSPQQNNATTVRLGRPR